MSDLNNFRNFEEKLRNPSFTNFEDALRDDSPLNPQIIRDDTNTFWFESPEVLYQNKNYLKFFPKTNMTRIEQLNAMTRFGVYLFGLFFLTESMDTWYLFPLLLIILSVIFYRILLVDQSQNYGQPIDTRPNVCEPTSENPFINPMEYNYNYNNEIDLATRPCERPDMQHPAVKERIKDLFTENLYMNVDDAYEKEGSMRQFFSVPCANYPNNQSEYAKWLYNSVNDSCKSNHLRCLKYEDLHYKR